MKEIAHKVVKGEIFTIRVKDGILKTHGYKPITVNEVLDAIETPHPNPQQLLAGLLQSGKIPKPESPGRWNYTKDIRDALIRTSYWGAQTIYNITKMKEHRTPKGIGMQSRRGNFPPYITYKKVKIWYIPDVYKWVLEQIGELDNGTT